MARRNPMLLICVAGLLLAGCPSKPEPWSPDGKSSEDTLSDGGVRNADVSAVPDTSFIDGTKPLPDTVADLVEVDGPGVDVVEEVTADGFSDLPPDVPCETSCGNAECGGDGCGGSCGECPGGESCVFGSCVAPGEPCDDGNGEPWDGCTEGIPTEFRINTNQLDDQRQPAVATLGDDFVVVWQSCDWNEYEEAPGHDGQGCGVFGTIVSAADGPGDEFQANVTYLDHQFLPDVARTPSGFVVSWVSFYPTPSVVVRAFDNDGNPLSQEASVPSTDHEATWRPAVACNASGDILVVWNGKDADSQQGVQGAYFTLTGASLEPSSEVGTINVTAYSDSIISDYKAPRVLALTNGSFLVAWSAVTADSEEWDVFGQLLEPGQFPTATEFLLNVEQVSYAQHEPALAVGPNDTFVATYLDHLVFTGGLAGVAVRQYDNSGEPQTVVKPVHTSGEAAELPDIAIAPSGQGLVTYTLFDEDGEEEADHIVAAGLSSQLAPGATTDLNVYTDGFQKFPRAAANGAGQFLVVWESCPWSPWGSSTNEEGQGEDGCGVFGRMLDGTAL